MGWFDEQIRERKIHDNEGFGDAFKGIAGAVMGARLADALEAEELAGSAIEEILRFYHIKTKNQELPPKIKTVEDQMEYRMRPHGIMRREVMLDGAWYKYAIGPMLGTLVEDGTPVALLPGKMGGYSFLNLKTGERVHITRKTAQLLDDEATCFYKPLPLKKLNMLDMLRFMWEQLSPLDLILFIGILALSALLGMLAPVFSKWLFGAVLQSGETRVLLSLSAFIFCFVLSQTLIQVCELLITARVSTKQDVAVEAAVMSRILSLPVTFFKEYSAGDLYQRSEYVKLLCSTLTETVASTGITSVFSLVYITQIVAYAPMLAAPALIATLATLVFTLISSFAQMKISREQMELSAKESGMSYAQITGIQKIKLAGAEKRMFSRWAKLYAKEASLLYNPPRFLKLTEAVTLAISLIGWMSIYIISVRSHISVENYYAFNTAYGMVSAAFMSFASIATVIANIKPVLEMAKPILQTVPEISEGRELIDTVRGSIELSHVSFRYDEGMPMVIDDLSLKISPGEYLAIVGGTGCGKSTLMRLLLGFETPQKGAIYYDRRDISRVDLKSLRRKIGVVMQNGSLFSGDIFSNITISAPQLTMDEAWEAAEIASLADDIRNMPMGMNTLISEGQGGISGGQKQRLMIARAVAPKPKILMFDEATSALDNITQKKVSEAIDSLRCTRIVIAHRLSTIRHCDRIIVLEKGRIVEDGSYDELIAKNGFFAELVARQRLDVED